MKYRKKKGKKQKAGVKTALVLSGGGAKGAYQVGVIEELLDRGVKFDLVTGSSIGAFNGALLAEFINSGLSNQQIIQRYNQIWREVKDFLRLNWSEFFKYFFTPFKVSSLFTNKFMKKILKKYIPENRIFSAYNKCQLSVTGTNLNDYELEVFDFNSRTPVNKAVLASMAYPGALPAVNINNDFYIDGGTLNNAPLKEAILWGAKLIFVVFLTPLKTISGPDHPQEDKKYFSALDVLGNLMDLATDKLMYGDLKNAVKINKLIKLINQYEKDLPPDFLDKICELYGLKSGDDKRIIQTIHIAPEEFLEPPGVMGFDKSEALKKLINVGKKDTGLILDSSKYRGL